jgi:DcmR-like sensory protein
MPGEFMNTSVDKIALGITEDEVALGSHLIHFWQSDEEFERGVRFLEIGMHDESQHFVLFGHEEGNQRALEILRRNGHDVDQMLRTRRLTILCRDCSAAETLKAIESAFSAAVDNGAEVIRYLGNLGRSEAPLPGRGADEIVELETGATQLALRYPCVIVCMYDVNTVSGALLLNAGFGAHPHAVCGRTLRDNPYCAAE